MLARNKDWMLTQERAGCPDSGTPAEQSPRSKVLWSVVRLTL